jgi:serine/threonine-protein kinase
MIGTTISHYRVLEKLGSGGMGEVFLAEDTRLGRRVALKFLPAHLTSDETAKARFIGEARAASALDHANICTIHDVEETAGGQLLLAMALCDGETLKARLAHGPMGVAEAVDLAAQVADGLSEAHARGIVHRDIKPANLMVTRTGRVKIVDFGIARAPGATAVTATGIAVGTPAYMAPEQARGEPIDARADLWALGVVLYESLTGRLPFPGDSISAILYAVVNRAPEPLDRVRQDLPVDLVRIVNRALMKDPLARYQQAEQMLADLGACRARLSSGDRHAAAATRAESSATIAVLPFANLSPEPEQEYFCDGMTEELISALGMLEGIRVAAHTSTFQLKGQGLSIRQIGERLGVDAVVEGSVRKAGDRLRVTAQLVNVSDGYHLWSERFDRRLDDVFAVQDEIASAIVGKLKGRLTVAPTSPIARRAPVTPDVYELYLKGRYYFARRYQGLLQPAVDCFRRATELDPEFAPAHAGLADALSLTGWFGYRLHREVAGPARQAAERAVMLDEALPEAHHALAMFHMWLDWDWEVIEREFRRALALNPNLPLTHVYLALASTTTDHSDEVLREIELGLALDPLSPFLFYLASVSCNLIRDYDRALSYAGKGIELEPDSVFGLHALGWATYMVGRYQEAIDTLTRCVTVARRMPYFLMFLGDALARAGRRAEAAEVVRELLERSRDQPAWFAGLVQVALGDFDAALPTYERAIREGVRPTPISFATAPHDPYRSDPRFAALLRSSGYTGTALFTRGAGP